MLHSDFKLVCCCACGVLLCVCMSGVETLGGKYELHDLVQLDAHTAGVIISIDKDTARVLTNQSTLQKNDVRLCRVSERPEGLGVLPLLLPAGRLLLHAAGCVWLTRLPFQRAPPAWTCLHAEADLQLL